MYFLKLDKHYSISNFFKLIGSWQSYKIFLSLIVAGVGTYLSIDYHIILNACDANVSIVPWNTLVKSIKKKR